MAVPKRRQSSAKSGMRKQHWQRKALEAARNALSLGKSLTTRNAKGFFYPPEERSILTARKVSDLAMCCNSFMICE